MYVKKMCGYAVSANMLCVLTKGQLDFYSPPTQESRNYKNWIAVLDLKTCLECRSHRGQIYQMDEMPGIEPPLHPNCRCDIRPMEAVIVGQRTKDGQNGADYWMKYLADLPEYYITYECLGLCGRVLLVKYVLYHARLQIVWEKAAFETCVSNAAFLDDEQSEPLWLLSHIERLSFLLKADRTRNWPCYWVNDCRKKKRKICLVWRSECD